MYNTLLRTPKGTLHQFSTAHSVYIVHSTLCLLQGDQRSHFICLTSNFRYAVMCLVALL